MCRRSATKDSEIVEQMTRLPNNPKLFDFQTACKIRASLRTNGQNVVLTNGCFDLLHAGHIYSLLKSAEYGDSLWIALNSDNSIKKLKGPGRPIFDEQTRAYMLSALEKVDGIFIFDTPTLEHEISQFQPDVYIKSGDYTVSKLNPIEYSALKSVQADIHFAPFLEGFSTTGIIRKIVDTQTD